MAEKSWRDREWHIPMGSQVEAVADQLRRERERQELEDAANACWSPVTGAGLEAVDAYDLDDPKREAFAERDWDLLRKWERESS